MKYKVVFNDIEVLEIENVSFCDNTKEVFYMKGEKGEILFLAPLNQVKYIVEVKS